MASMIATINSIVAGAGAAPAHAWMSEGDQIAVSVPLGLTVAAAAFATFFAYQNRRYQGLHVPAAPVAARAPAP